MPIMREERSDGETQSEGSPQNTHTGFAGREAGGRWCASLLGTGGVLSWGRHISPHNSGCGNKSISTVCMTDFLLGLRWIIWPLWSLRVWDRFIVAYRDFLLHQSFFSFLIPCNFISQCLLTCDTQFYLHSEYLWLSFYYLPSLLSSLDFIFPPSYLYRISVFSFPYKDVKLFYSFKGYFSLVSLQKHECVFLPHQCSGVTMVGMLQIAN